MEIYRYIVKYYDEVSTRWAQHTHPAGSLPAGCHRGGVAVVPSACGVAGPGRDAP